MVVSVLSTFAMYSVLGERRFRDLVPALRSLPCAMDVANPLTLAQQLEASRGAAKLAPRSTYPLRSNWSQLPTIEVYLHYVPVCVARVCRYMGA